MHHEIWAEEIGPIAPGAVSLRSAGKFELRGLKKFTFDLESRVEGRFRVFRDKRPEEIQPHAGVEILTDLQADFDFFGEGRRNVFRDLILRDVGARVPRIINRGGIGSGLDLDACSDESFTKYSFCKLGRRWYG